MAERFLFNLADTIEQHVPLDARLIVLNSTKQAFEQLLRTDPGNAGWQRDLSVSYERDRRGAGGAGQSARGDEILPRRRWRSENSWRRGRRQRRPAARSGGGARKVGDAMVAQGNLPEALKSFREALAIRERLARTDPGNADWQHDLAVAHEKIGEVMMAQGNLPQALKSFRDWFTIADRLADADPPLSGTAIYR